MNTRFTALEIGSGDAFLLEDDGITILFDSGGSQSRIKDLLKEKGIMRIDIAICSHNDGDHTNGFIGLLKSKKTYISEIWLPYWWSSILQYADEYDIDWDEIEKISNEINNENIRDYNPQLLYSYEHEPLSDEAFNIVLSRLAKSTDYKGISSSNNKYIYDMACDIVHNMIDLLDNDSVYRLFITPDSEIAHRTAHDIASRVAYRVARHVAYDVAYDVARQLVSYSSYRTSSESLRHYLLDHIDAFLPSSSVTANSENNIRILFNNIMEIAVLAHQRGCRIKWFEPTKSGTNHPIQYNSFIALNSTLKRQVQKLRNTFALAFALHLTVENEYSLAFEYLKYDIPIIRFSADSDCECTGSHSLYEHNIIVTAPHHGSPANANVYNAIDPNNQDNIIWVRSDALNKTQGRPCHEFKLRKNKYCLACNNRNLNQKFEICFEYDPWLKQWNHIRGELCRCK